MSRSSYFGKQSEKVQNLPLDIRREISHYLYRNYPFILDLAILIYNDLYNTNFRRQNNLPLSPMPLFIKMKDYIIDLLIDLYGYNLQKGLDDFKTKDGLLTRPTYFEIYDKAEFFIKNLAAEFDLEKQRYQGLLGEQENPIAMGITKAIIQKLDDDNLFIPDDLPFLVKIKNQSIHQYKNDIFVFPSMTIGELRYFLLKQTNCIDEKLELYFHRIGTTKRTYLENDLTIGELNLNPSDQIIARCAMNSFGYDRWPDLP